MIASTTFTFLLAVAPLATEASPVPKDSQEYKLVWSQEFNKDGTPDDADWGYEHGFVRNEEDQWYQPENARIQNGCLVIEAQRQEIPNPWYKADSRDWRHKRKVAQYTSTSMTTHGKHEWLYGRFVMRARIDTRPGLWPAWWTLGSARNGRYWPACGEIDIMEYYDGVILANACWHKGHGQQHWDAVRKPLRDFNKNWSSQFHIWRMDWNKNSILIYVDDQLLNTVAITETRNPDGSNPFREPHYMIVNLAIGGIRGGDPSKTKFPARYEIDYIRVYQKPSQENSSITSRPAADHSATEQTTGNGTIVPLESNQDALLTLR